MTTLWLSGPDALAPYIPAWEQLAEAALEPNPFYEPWMLLPALRHFTSGKNVKVLAIFKDGQLCGIVPLERIRPYMGLPVTALGLWRYNHCPLSMPLIRADCAAEVLSALFHWAQTNEADCHLLELRNVLGDGAFHRLLVDGFHDVGTIPLVWEWYTRALFRPMENAELYLNTALSSKHRKAFRRRAEQLGEIGPVDYSLIRPDDDINQWIESFLRIESSGWKGREGSAMACRPEHRAFFVEVVSSAFRKNRLLMPAMTVGGKTIAQNCYFLAGRGSFHFKPAFDEEYSRFSPGFHMECELIRHLHSRPEVEWMDSCTSTGNEMYNRLFLYRRTIQTLLVPVRGGLGGLLVAAIPALRYLRRSARSVFRSSQTEQAACSN